MATSHADTDNPSRPATDDAFLPLASGEFRLFRIQRLVASPEPFSQIPVTIFCELKTFPLHSAPSFSALSYTWGSDAFLAQLDENGYTNISTLHLSLNSQMAL
jgi:hypothetical protein